MGDMGKSSVIESRFVKCCLVWAAVLLLSVPANAASFKFSFYNALGDEDIGSTFSYTPAFISGEVHGLSEGTSSATSVVVLESSDGLGLGEYVGDPRENVWTVVGGEITTFNFRSFGARNTFPAVTTASLFFDSTDLDGYFDHAFRAGLTFAADVITIGDSGVRSSLDIQLTFTPISEVPLPSTLAFFAPVLLGFGMIKRRQSQS